MRFDEKKARDEGKTMVIVAVIIATKDTLHSVWFIRNAVLFKPVRSLAILAYAIVVSITS